MADNFSDNAEWAIAKDLHEQAMDGDSITEELNAIPLDDRLSIARKMEQYSKIQHEENGQYELTIEFGTDIYGQEHLTNIEVEDWGPNTDVYDMPKEGIGRFAADTAGSQELDAEIISLQNGNKYSKNVDGELELYADLLKARSIPVPARLDKDGK